MSKMRGGIMYDQREIVLIPFPYSDLTGNKKRPALIISNSKLNKTEDRICCLVSSKFHKDDVEIKISDFQEGKLPFKSSVRAHRIFTIDQRIIIKRLCVMNEGFHNRVITKINEYTLAE
jgi:mRNA interferase MazF